MKEDISVWFQAVSGSLEILFSQFASFLPGLLAAIVIVVIGYFIARILRFGVAAILKRVGVDTLGAATGIDVQLSKLGDKASISSALSLMIFWIVFLVFIITAADSLGLSQLGQTMDQFLLFMPKLIAATLILLFGLTTANLIKSTVYESAKSAGFDFARPLSKVSFILVVVLTLSLTIGQLEIETRLLDAIIIIVLAALGVGAAISLGLGSRSAAENIVYSIYIGDTVKVGDKVTINDGTRGEVVEIGAVATTIRTPDESLKVVDNKGFLSGLSIH
ncbi:MAG: hypothetical protein ACI8Z9_002301 [Paraglaciecola sp.]|jgi:small-conductance mechanosensitive channel